MPPFGLDGQRGRVKLDYLLDCQLYHYLFSLQLQIHRISAQNACQSRSHCDNHLQDHVPYGFLHCHHLPPFCSLNSLVYSVFVHVLRLCCGFSGILEFLIILELLEFLCHLKARALFNPLFRFYLTIPIEIRRKIPVSAYPAAGEFLL